MLCSRHAQHSSSLAFFPLMLFHSAVKFGLCLSHLTLKPSSAAK